MGPLGGLAEIWSSMFWKARYCGEAVMLAYGPPRSGVSRARPTLMRLRRLATLAANCWRAGAVLWARAISGPPTRTAPPGATPPHPDRVGHVRGADRDVGERGAVTLDPREVELPLVVDDLGVGLERAQRAYGA